jgi:hypothetical protein
MFKEGQQVYLVTPFYSEKICSIVKGQIEKGYIIKVEHPHYLVSITPGFADWHYFHELIECY